AGRRIQPVERHMRLVLRLDSLIHCTDSPGTPEAASRRRRRNSRRSTVIGSAGSSLPGLGLLPSRYVECAGGVLPAIGVDQVALDIDVTLDRPLIGGRLLDFRRLIVLVGQSWSSCRDFHRLGLYDATCWPSVARSGCFRSAAWSP